MIRAAESETHETAMLLDTGDGPVIVYAMEECEASWGANVET